MKKSLFILFACLVLGQAAQAKDCWPEKFSKGGKGGIGIKISSMSSSSATWSFAHSSGTSGCGSNTASLRKMELRRYIVLNMDRITEEAARGGGDYLHSLAVLLGCQRDLHPEFFRMTQHRFVALFPDMESRPPAFIAGLHREIEAHPRLRSGCAGDA